MIDWIIAHKIQLILTLILSVINGFGYMLGGKGSGFPRWIRPVSSGLTVLITMLLWFKFDWWIVVSAGATAGFSTAYFKSGDTMFWYHWLAHGIALSLSVLPWVYFSHAWVGFIIRTIVLSGGISLWSQLIGKSQLEQGGRGGLIIATIPLMLI